MIELPEMFIVTGGAHYGSLVSQYTEDGFVGNLPSLNDRRQSHGCGFFYNDDNERVRTRSDFHFLKSILGFLKGKNTLFPKSAQ